MNLKENFYVSAFMFWMIFVMKHQSYECEAFLKLDNIILHGMYCKQTFKILKKENMHKRIHWHSKHLHVTCITSKLYNNTFTVFSKTHVSLWVLNTFLNLDYWYIHISRHVLCKHSLLTLWMCTVGGMTVRCSRKHNPLS